VRILRGRDYPALPWRNGRGVARQIVASPPGADYGSLDWQVSRTAIERDTPFSKLAGLDRQFVLVSGKGVILHLRSAADRVDFVQPIDRPLEPFAFRGDWDVDCTLVDGAVEVLNVMSRRGRAAARIEVREVTVPVLARKAAGETLALYAVEALTAFGIWGTDALPPDDSVVVDEPEMTEIAIAAAGKSPARAVLIRLGHT
jgi:environmental stress-induced protein Ves